MLLAIQLEDQTDNYRVTKWSMSPDLKKGIPWLPLEDIQAVSLELSLTPNIWCPSESQSKSQKN